MLIDMNFATIFIIASRPKKQFCRLKRKIFDIFVANKFDRVN